MNTQEFLQKILPANGYHVLAEFWFGLDQPPKHTAHESIESMVQRIHYVDGKGKNVFHACAAYYKGDKEELPPRPDGKPRKSIRFANNVSTVKSQWLDVDIGPTKDYQTAKEALSAVKSMCETLGIPLPMIVKSGRGLHCYWPFTHPVLRDEAKRGMEGFSAALHNCGFKHDTSRTTDLASILRPVGAHHRKGEPIEVRLLRDADLIDPDQFYAYFADVIPPTPLAAIFQTDEWGSGQEREYPPSEARRVYQHCAALREVADVQGNVDEPLWRNMLGLVKHCVEGISLAQKWSKGHPDYRPEETEEKYENWGAGPPTCEQFGRCTDACGPCPHNGKIKSPIHLGYADPEETPAEPVNTLASEDIEDSLSLSPVERTVVSHSRKQPSALPFWPKKYRWDGGLLSRFIKPPDPDEPGIWQPFLDKLAYPFVRYADDDGEMQLRVTLQVNQAKNRWKEFDIPAKALADNKAFSAACGAYEVYTMGDKGTLMARQFFQDVVGQMQELDIETKAHTNFGWQKDAFVIGTTAITRNSVEPVFLSDKVPSDARVDFGTAGTSQDWARLIDDVYNRPGAEAYQFLICAGFGAPLISLVNSDLWHGIPIALTGESGQGKTTTCMVACSMYGQPGKFAISTNDLGSTMNALISRVGLMRHLPMVLDEMTGRKTEELQGMLYALSNGKPKERNRADGSLIDSNNRWDTLTFITGNMNITSMLAQLDKHRAEATQLRCFEIPLEEGFNERLFSDINAKDMIEDQLLRQNYGEAGREYLQYVIKHRQQISRQLAKLRAKFAPSTRDETRERFYYDCVATAVMGGVIARKLGLLDFDMGKVQKWAVQHIKSLRTNRVANLSSVEDYLASFLSTLHGRTVITEKFADARTGLKYEVDTREVRQPIARIAREDKLFYIMNKHFTEWCSENNVNAKWFKDELDKRGMLVHQQGNTTGRQSIFKGTSLPTTQGTVIQLDYDALLGTAAGTNLRAVSTQPAAKPIKSAKPGRKPRR